MTWKLAETNFRERERERENYRSNWLQDLTGKSWEGRWWSAAVEEGGFEELEP